MTPAVSQIIRRTLPHFGLEGVEPEYLATKDRHASVALARQVCAWLCRALLRMSYPEIGLAFGKDHTTMMHAVGRIDRMVADRPDYWASVAARRLLVEIQQERALAVGQIHSGAQNIDVGPPSPRALELAEQTPIAGAP